MSRWRQIHHLDNPWIELEEHDLNPDHQVHLELGYQPTHDMERELGLILNDHVRYRHRILARQHGLIPDIRWDRGREKMRSLA